MINFRIVGAVAALLIVVVGGLYMRGELLLSREKLKLAKAAIVIHKQTIDSNKKYINKLEVTAKLKDELVKELNSNIEDLRSKNEKFQQELTELKSDEDTTYLHTTIPNNVRRLLER